MLICTNFSKICHKHVFFLFFLYIYIIYIYNDLYIYNDVYLHILLCASTNENCFNTSVMATVKLFIFFFSTIKCYYIL